MIPIDKIINHDDSEAKICGKDYYIEWEYTCMKCNHNWRLSSRSNNMSCPKCRSYKVYYVSKRSIDEFIDNDEVVEIPKDSELL